MRRGKDAEETIAGWGNVPVPGRERLTEDLEAERAGPSSLLLGLVALVRRRRRR